MVNLPYAHLSYQDRLFDAPTCFMCKRFPIDTNETHYCEFRLNKIISSKRKACIKGFIPITEQEFNLKMYLRELLHKEQKWRYRYRNRIVRCEKQRDYVRRNISKNRLSKKLYNESHKEQNSEYRKKYYLENREKMLEYSILRSQIRRYNPINKVLHLINYHKNKERKLSS